jgi:hypothetical protein
MLRDNCTKEANLDQIKQIQYIKLAQQTKKCRFGGEKIALSMLLT